MLFYRYQFEQNDMQTQYHPDRCVQRESGELNSQNYRVELKAGRAMKEQIVQKGELFSDGLKGKAFFFVENMRAGKFSVIGILKAVLLHTDTPHIHAGNGLCKHCRNSLLGAAIRQGMRGA